jgi:membrane-bound ClpP family serine protease
MGDLWSLLASNLPELILLLVGVGLLVVEMYIPGFGVPGILGIVTMGLGFILLRPTPAQGLLLLVILAAVLCLALIICLITASKGRLERSKLALRDVAIDPEAAAENDLNYLIGKTGVTRTALRPAGIAEFEGVKLNVVSDGEFIAQGKRIRVLSVAGNRIVVREMTQTEPDKEV